MNDDRDNQTLMESLITYLNAASSDADALREVMVRPEIEAYLEKLDSDLKSLPRISLVPNKKL